MGSPRRQQRGLSLIEVMWSMLIISSGLLGVLLILPVAGQRVTQGTTADAANRVGHNAEEAFFIRQMNRSDRWLGYDSSSNVVAVKNTSLAYPHLPYYDTSLPPISNSNLYHRMSFCLDPFGFMAGEGWFPYSAIDPQMPRISLRVQPGSSTLMTREHAISVFVSEHDLAFGIPDDESFPVQEFGSDNAKRQANGVFSWFATLTPQLQYRTPGNDYFVLSIVVCQRRELSGSSDYSAIKPEGEPDNERAVGVDFNVPAGWTVSEAGGDVTFTTVSRDDGTGSGTNRHFVDDLHVSENNWVMLAGRHPVQPPQGSVPDDLSNHPIFKWYKVTSVGEITSYVDSSGNTGYQRDVTLHGQDWPINSAATPDAHAVLVNDVIAVYEKTIRIQTSAASDY